MNIFVKIIYRIIQKGFHIAIPFLPYRKPIVLDHTNDIIHVLASKNIHRVMLVTDAGLRQAGITATLEEQLHSNNIITTVFDHTCANPTVHNVNEARAMYLENNCEALIAMGGGSSMDCAKCTGALIAYPKRNVYQLRGLLRVWRKLPPFFAIPTTAGTGSEATLAAVITDSEVKHKYTMNSFPLIPHYAVLDPEVTVSLPPNVTATTGMDALTHAVEAYIGRSTTKETRKLSLEATQLIFDNLLNAYEDGGNIEARRNMLIASHKAGLSFTKSYVGYIHAVAHSLGGQYNIPHGLANAVLLPVILEAYGPCVHSKLKDLAVAAGIADENDSSSTAARKFIREIYRLNKAMDIPATFEEIQEEDIPVMARYADIEANPLYPVPTLMDRKELETFYHLVSVKQRKNVTGKKQNNSPEKALDRKAN